MHIFSMCIGKLKYMMYLMTTKNWEFDVQDQDQRHSSAFGQHFTMDEGTYFWGENPCYFMIVSYTGQTGQ